MAAGIWFWIIYVIVLIFSGYWGWVHTREHGPMYIAIFILLGLLGWGTFGPPIK